MNRGARARRAVSSVLASTVAAAALVRLGDGVLAPPPLSWDGTARWLATRDAVVVTLALVRVVALALVAYLAVVTSVALIARATRARSLAHLVDRLTLPLVRQLVATALGAGALGIAAATPPPAPSATTAVVRDVPPDTAVIRTVPEPLPPATPAPPAPPPADDTVVLARGDSLWAVAHDHLVDVRGREVDDDEVARYWLAVVDANRASLVVPEDADLVFAGQSIALPPVAPS